MGTVLNLNFFILLKDIRCTNRIRKGNNLMIRKAVIPAAGLGARILPLTKTQPKEMLPLGKKPCIQYIVEELASVGVNQILIITGKKKRAI